MKFQDIILDRGDVTVLTVDRPASRNAIDFSTMDEIERAMTELDHDQRLRALILTGGGDTFISGGDLRSFQSLRTAESGRSMATRMGAILLRISRLPAPVIAAMNGPALGGGTEVALACDLRVAAANAYFSFRQITMGIMTAWGGAPRLLEAVGGSRALYYLLTAEHITPEQALRLGLVHRVAPAGQALPQALQLAREIAAQPPLAVRAFKSSLHAMHDLSFDAASRVEVEEFAKLWGSHDHDEAVHAYFEKRAPVFEGR